MSMYKQRIRFLFPLLCLLILCSTVQATNLQITVQDSIDNTSVSRATVYLDGSNLGRTNNAGQFMITHGGLNDLNLRITMNGYDDWSGTVKKDATSYLVNLTRRSLLLKVNLLDSDTLQPVSGATLELTAGNVTQTKTSDATGTASFGVISSTQYSLDISAQNYQPRTTTVDIESEDKTVQYWLLSGNRFSFIVKDKNTQAYLSDAEIRIDSVLVGKTDSRGVLIAPITRGKLYTIDVTKTGYQGTSLTKTISDTEAMYTVSLAKVPLGAFIFVTDENHVPLANADLYINGTIAGSSNPYGRATLSNLAAGSYDIEVRKAGYSPTPLHIVVSKDAGDFSVVLPYEKVNLMIYVQDKEEKNLSNATITIDGIVSGVTDSHGQYVVPVKYGTKYNISSSKEGYNAGFVSTEVASGNASPSVTITLEKNFDWGLLPVILAGFIGIILLLLAIRILGRRKRRHVMRRNEI